MPKPLSLLRAQPQRLPPPGHALSRPPAVALALGVMVLTVLGCKGEDPAPGAGRQRPNVLFIVADDLRTQLGAYGRPEMSTPHFDRLAARSVLFERAYCQFPLCNPSRTSFLSGLRPVRTGVFTNADLPRALVPGLTFLPEVFRRRGYYTFRAGKILHAEFEGEIEWDEVSALEGAFRRVSRTPPAPGWRSKNVQAVAQPAPGSHLAGLEYVYWQEVSDQEGRHLSDAVVADETIRLLGKARRHQPFFAGVGFSMPHLPYVAPSRFFRMYPVDQVALPDAPPDDLADVPPRAVHAAKRHPEMPPREQREMRGAYYAAVSFMDEQLGRILDALDRLGLAESTIIVFLGDHGVHLGEHGGLWEKMTLFEETTRVPLLIAAPGIPPGRAPSPVELVDLFPTLLQLASMKRPEGLDGKSLVRHLRDPAEHRGRGAETLLRFGKDALLWGRALRTERYRYNEWLTRRDSELYDHQTDPGEHQNLANDPAYIEVKRRHHRLLQDIDAVAAASATLPETAAKGGSPGT